MNNIAPITIASTLRFGHGAHIGEELILIDKFSNIPLPMEPRRMECLLLALCTRGTLQYNVNTMHYTVKPGDLIIVSEGQVTDRCSMSDDCEGVAIMVDYKFFYEVIKGIGELSSLFLFSRNHPVYSLTEADQQVVLNYFNILCSKTKNEAHRYRRQLVQSLFTTLIIDLGDAISRIQNLGDVRRTRAEKIFNIFIHQVEQNFRTERRVEWYARQMEITPKYLSEVVRMISSRTPSDWIDSYVTLEIRVMLRNTSLSVKEIAEQLSFPNQSFFGRYFKERVGLTPTEYRHQR